MIEDLSYSGLSGLIDGDIKKGREALIELSNEYIVKKAEIADRERKLAILKQDHDAIYGGIQKVMKHLELSYPLAIKIDAGIIVISEKAITLETNVL